MGTSANAVGPFARAVNEKIRQLMLDRGISQVRLSEMTGIPQTSISNAVFRERSALTVHNFELICRSLGVRPGAIADLAEQQDRDSGAGPA